MDSLVRFLHYMGCGNINSGQSDLEQSVINRRTIFKKPIEEIKWNTKNRLSLRKIRKKTEEKHWDRLQTQEKDGRQTQPYQ